MAFDCAFLNGDDGQEPEADWICIGMLRVDEGQEETICRWAEERGLYPTLMIVGEDKLDGFCVPRWSWKAHAKAFISSFKLLGVYICVFGDDEDSPDFVFNDKVDSFEFE